jgi:hypothetical protein
LGRQEFCDKGLKTLVLERGRNVEHVKDYPTASKAPGNLIIEELYQLNNVKIYKGQEIFAKKLCTGR